MRRQPNTQEDIGFLHVTTLSVSDEDIPSPQQSIPQTQQALQPHRASTSAISSRQSLSATTHSAPSSSRLRHSASARHNRSSFIAPSDHRSPFEAASGHHSPSEGASDHQFPSEVVSDEEEGSSLNIEDGGGPISLKLIKDYNTHVARYVWRYPGYDQSIEATYNVKRIKGLVKHYTR